MCAAGLGGFAGPLFDGFRQPLRRQPGAIISFPPTQWTRKQSIGRRPPSAVSGAWPAHTPGAAAEKFDTRRGMVVGSPVLVDGIDPTDATRGLADCAPGCPGRPCVLVGQRHGGGQSGSRATGYAKLVGLKYHAEQPSASGPVSCQRGRAGQPEALRRRIDGLRHGATTGYGTQRRRRESEGSAPAFWRTPPALTMD